MYIGIFILFSPWSCSVKLLFLSCVLPIYLCTITFFCFLFSLFLVLLVLYPSHVVLEPVRLLKPTMSTAPVSILRKQGGLSRRRETVLLAPRPELKFSTGHFLRRKINYNIKTTSPATFHCKITINSFYDRIHGSLLNSMHDLSSFISVAPRNLVLISAFFNTFLSLTAVC